MLKKETEEQEVAPAAMNEDKVKDFLKEYGELVTKHGLDFASYPVYIPDGQGGFKVIVQSTPVDISKQPQKSPFVAQA